MVKTFKFQSTQFSDRTMDMPVPEMKAFYPDGVEPCIKIKGLTAEELAKAEYEVSLNRQTIREMNKAGIDDDTIKALRTILKSYGTEDTPDNHVKMLNFVRSFVFNILRQYYFPGSFRLFYNFF